MGAALAPAPCPHGKSAGSCVPCRQSEIQTLLEKRVLELEAENAELKARIERRFDPAYAEQRDSSSDEDDDEDDAPTCNDLDCGHPKCCVDEDGDCGWCYEVDESDHCSHPRACEDDGGDCQWCKDVDPQDDCEHPGICNDGSCQWCADVEEAKEADCEEQDNCSHPKCAENDDGDCQWCLDTGEQDDCTHPRCAQNDNEECTICKELETKRCELMRGCSHPKCAYNGSYCVICREINVRQTNIAVAARMQVAMQALGFGFTDFHNLIVGSTAIPMQLPELQQFVMPEGPR